ncbi:MAG TPA: SDR family oxidoreductase [Pseudonocardiaceae bacterium]
MREPILVTGGSGVLGRAVVDRLVAAGHRVRVMSRRPAPAELRPELEWATADLRTGEGVAAAVSGAGVIVHCATSPTGRGSEVEMTRSLVEAARETRSHLVYVSIVGIDRVPFGYYRQKVAAERVVEDSGVPYTIQRATQFHDLLRVLLAYAARLPVMVVPDLRFQPIDTQDVAARLAELATGDPVGRAPDLGGPEVREMTDLARVFLSATGRRRRVVPVRLPGATFRGYRQGGHLAPEHADGRITFEQYLAAHPEPATTAYRMPHR